MAASSVDPEKAQMGDDTGGKQVLLISSVEIAADSGCV